MTGAERDAMQTRVKELEAQLKKEQNKFNNRRRTLGIGLGIGVPSTIAASVLFDAYRRKK